MPKRSTAFQKLVYLARKHSADGSTVTESKFVLDSKGRKREVDICIESVVGGTPVTISIECNEKKRKASAPWVEEMKGKHDDLPTDKLILYSRSGFTKGAQEKARTYRKDLVALETLDETSAGRLFDGARLISCKTSKQTPTKVMIGLAAGGGLPAKEETFLFPADNTIAIFDESGQEVGGLQILVSQILHSPKVMHQYLQISEDKHKNFTVGCGSVGVGQDNKPIFLRFDTAGSG